jgi:hypothetical protein
MRKYPGRIHVPELLVFLKAGQRKREGGAGFGILLQRKLAPDALRQTAAERQPKSYAGC